MTSFRMKRILSLREKQATQAKLAWADMERAAKDVEDARNRTIEVLNDGREAARSIVGANAASAAVFARTSIAAYERLDALAARAAHESGQLDEARAAAGRARDPYDARRRDVEALLRLEERWKREAKEKRKRREDRSRDEALQALRALRGHASTNGSNPSRSL